MAIPVRIGNTISLLASGANNILEGTGCVSNTEGYAIMGANDNDSNFVGFAVASASAGDPVTLAQPGSVVQAIGGTSAISAGDYLMLYGASGRVTSIATVSASSYYVVGQALEACDTAGDKLAIMVCNFRDHC